MEHANSDVIEIDIKEIFFVLLHKIWIILLATLIGASSAGVISTYLIQPIYTSMSSVYVINRQDETKMTLSDLQTGTQLTKDYMILVKSRPVTEQVISNLNLDMTSDQLAGLIQVNTPEDTRILEIIVKHQDPSLAKQLADAVAEISSERMVSVMEMEKVNIIEEGNLPRYPSSPNVRKNTILGGLLGLGLSSIIIVLIYLLNDNIRTSEDIEKYLGITTLGILPLEEQHTRKKNKKEGKIKPSRRKRKAALAS
jgi:capsular polysaccharide biosynthesis protein